MDKIANNRLLNIVIKTTVADQLKSITNNDNSDMPAYDASKEPLTVEAAFANKLADTLNIKMYEITLKPGDTVALHNHPDHSMYVIQGGKLAITVEGKEAKEFDMKPYLPYPIYEPLNDKVFFQKAKVMMGTVVWNDEIDMSPDTLYLEGRTVVSQ